MEGKWVLVADYMLERVGQSVTAEDREWLVEALAELARSRGMRASGVVGMAIKAGVSLAYEGDDDV